MNLPIKDGSTRVVIIGPLLYVVAPRFWFQRCLGVKRTSVEKSFLENPKSVRRQGPGVINQVLAHIYLLH